MPTSIRPDNKAKKIAENIIGKPENMQEYRKRAKKKKSFVQLQTELAFMVGGEPPAPPPPVQEE